MRSRRIIKQGDKMRAMLTDLIPYEVPIRFSFSHLYRRQKTKERLGKWTKKLLEHRISDSIPYSYVIKSGEAKNRQLGLIHPLLLDQMASFYDDYHGVIVNLCQKSTWSLRFPTRVAKMYFTAEDRIAGTGEQGEGGAAASLAEVGEFQGHASSYFVYESCNLMQRFFESDDLLQLEARFRMCRRLDIAKCFGNIYTHSISWATKGKPNAKKEIQSLETFDAKFDKLMRISNHGETHGILVGSEMARIFAEIILQEVDVRADTRLRQDLGRGYDVRRYIDDWFIFYNEESVATAVQHEIERCLSDYKLYWNQHKTNTDSRPFLTPVSVAKKDVNKYLINVLDTSEDNLRSENPNQSRRVAYRSRKLVREIREIVVRHNVDYGQIAGYILKCLQNQLVRKSAFLRNDNFVSIANEWVSCIVETAFHMLSLDVRFRTVLLVGDILIGIRKEINEGSRLDERRLGDVIAREFSNLIENLILSKEDNAFEVVNLLICLRDSEFIGAMNFGKIIDYMKSQDRIKNGDYFVTVAAAYFCGNFVPLQGFQTEILEVVCKRVVGSPNVSTDTELLCLALDMLSCTWVSQPAKTMIAHKILAMLGEKNPTNAVTADFLAEFTSDVWLFDWRSSVPTARYLEKKELVVGY